MSKEDIQVNVLLVDDHPGSLMALGAALEPLGNNLVKCDSGHDALRQLLRRVFAVIILDVRLPDINGFEVAAIIRERPSSRDTPIIFLTGHSKDKPEVSRGYSLGAVDYLLKPVEPDILRAKIRVFVDLFRKTEQVRQQTEQIFTLRERERERKREAERLSVERELLVKEKEVAEALAQQAAELQRSNAELEQFAYLASHDLQEPLRTITSFSQLLREEYSGKLGDDADKYLRFISDAATRMTMLIRGLLDHSRIGKRDDAGPVDCNEVVEEVLSDLNASISEAGSEIRVGKLPVLELNRSAFRLLVQNLLSNAVKFRRKDGSTISFSAAMKDGFWRFSVADNGIGIDVRHQEKIFQLFHRVGPEEECEGTGIGLAHCRKIVELFGGRIWVESKPGRGSTFYFTIPL